jgi:hypothetical protein
VNQRLAPEAYRNGYAPAAGKETSAKGIGKTDYLDKSMHSWAADAPISGQRFQAGIPNDFTDGDRGMARWVKGAKKFVRTRVRLHENASTRRLADSAVTPGEPSEK